MRPDVVELVDEGVEALLLLEQVRSRRTGRLELERAVHPLVPAILLGMGRPDALELDPEPQPKTESLVSPARPVDANGTPLSERMTARQAMRAEDLLAGLARLLV